MGHLLEAFKKLDQKRAAIRPKSVRRTPAVQPAATIWRIDEPHRIAAAHRTAEPDRAAPPAPAPPLRQTDGIQRADETQLASCTVPAPETVVAPEARPSANDDGRTATNVGWRFPAPEVASDYYDLAARLVSRAGQVQRPQSVLISAVSNAALDAVSLAALAVVLSARGNVLWIDTRNIWPTPAAVGPALGKKPGWHELLLRQANWEEIITPTSLAGVSFVGCGEGAREASGQELNRQPFATLGSAFAFVLIDGGLVEESASLASVCGVTGLVVAIGRQRRSQVDRALDMLSTAGGGPPVLIAFEPRGPQ